MWLKNYKKIIFLAAVLGIISFAFVFFYNEEGTILAQKQWEWICQDEEMEVIMQHFEEGEIPIGEAADGTLAMAKEIIRNYDLMLPAGGQLVAAANAVYDLDLPGACRAERCNSDCNVDIYSCNSFDCNCIEVCGEVCEEVCETPCTTIERCRSSELDCENDRPPLSVCQEQTEIICVDVERCRDTEAECLAIKPDDETCDKVQKEVLPGGFILWHWCFDEEMCDPVSEWCWEEEECDTFCWDECEDVCETTCETCWQTCYDCNIDACGGEPCPTDLTDELKRLLNDIINPKASAISSYAKAINDEVQKAPGFMDLLRKARLGLKECATPASGYEPSEAVQLIESLISCEETKFFKVLSQDQEDCYLSNFFCCEPVE